MRTIISFIWEKDILLLHSGAQKRAEFGRQINNNNDDETQR